MGLQLKGIIKEICEEKNKINTCKYEIIYEKYDAFKDIDNSDIDEFFMYILEKQLNGSSVKFDDKTYRHTQKSTIMKTFFEKFFNEFSIAKDNINRIKESQDKLKKLTTEDNINGIKESNKKLNKSTKGEKYE